MKIDLIQPFISAVDAVLAETMQSPVTIGGLNMADEGYRKKGVAAMIAIKGAIEGRVILDMEPRAAARVASYLAGEDITLNDQGMRETVSELANMVIGNAVTQLNDRGFQFKVLPPSVLTDEQDVRSGQDSEATILRFETSSGNVHLNIGMRYHGRRSREKSPVAGG